MPPVAKAPPPAKPNPPPYRGAIVDLWNTNSKVVPAMVVAVNGSACDISVIGAPMHAFLVAVPFGAGKPWWWAWGPK